MHTLPTKCLRKYEVIQLKNILRKPKPQMLWNNLEQRITNILEKLVKRKRKSGKEESSVLDKKVACLFM